MQASPPWWCCRSRRRPWQAIRRPLDPSASRARSRRLAGPAARHPPRTHTLPGG